MEFDLTIPAAAIEAAIRLKDSRQEGSDERLVAEAILLLRQKSRRVEQELAAGNSVRILQARS